MIFKHSFLAQQWKYLLLTLYVAFSLLIASLCQSPPPFFQSFLSMSFNQLNCLVTGKSIDYDRFVIVEFPDIPLPFDSFSFEPLRSVLKKLSEVTPELALFYPPPYVRPESSLHQWMKSFKDNEHIVFLDAGNDFPYQSPFIPGGGLQKYSNSEISMSFGFLGEPTTLKYSRDLGNDTFLRYLWQTHQSLRHPEIPLHYYFKSSTIQRISDRDFLNLNAAEIQSKSFIFYTGYSSAFGKPFLTPVGLMPLEHVIINGLISFTQLPESKTLSPYVIIFSFLIISAVFWMLLNYFGITICSFNILSSFFIHVLIHFYFFTSNTDSYASTLLIFHLFMGVITCCFSIILTYLGKNFQYLQIKTMLESQNKILWHLQKTGDLGKLSASILHEISHPVHNINTALRILENDESISNEARETLNILIAEAKRLKKMNLDYKSLYKNSEHDSFSPIKNIIHSCIKLIEPDLLKMNIQTDIKIKHNKTIMVPDDKFKQVILNLLINCIEASGDEGAICIETHDDKNNVLIDISDCGTGISDELKDNIFKPYFTTKKGQGSGLGLYICREILQHFQSQILIIPPVSDKFTTSFRLVLPQREVTGSQSS